MSHEKTGGRLARQQELGLPGWARRFESQGAASPPSSSSRVNSSDGSQPEAERARAELPPPPVDESQIATPETQPSRQTKLTIAKQAVKTAEAESAAKRGRPKRTSERPWEAEGLSRSAYYRRKAGEEERRAELRNPSPDEAFEQPRQKVKDPAVQPHTTRELKLTLAREAVKVVDRKAYQREWARKKRAVHAGD